MHWVSLPSRKDGIDQASGVVNGKGKGTYHLIVCFWEVRLLKDIFVGCKTWEL